MMIKVTYSFLVVIINENALVLFSTDMYLNIKGGKKNRTVTLQNIEGPKNPVKRGLVKHLTN